MIGSVWQKWDLHLHTPLTHQNNLYGELTTDEFAQKIVGSELSLIGVTNYFYFAENELEIVRNVVNKAKGASITVLGNIEFRINQQNKDGEWINIHCIFSDKLSSNQINKVLSTLPIVNTTADEKTIYCTHQSFVDSSISTSDALIDANKLVDHLKLNLKFGVDFLIAACPNGYGGFRPDMTEGRSLALALEIEKKCQIILGRPQDREFFLKERYDGAKPKPVFVGSDAHKIESVGASYSWVKAKPTFEGLRQALIEPEDRVQQTNDFTENTYIKPRFKSITIGGTIFPGQTIQFSPQTIPLNPNMVAIIGGRGTGKSLFLDAMHSMFNDRLKSHYAREVQVENLAITLNQGDGTELIFDSKNNNPYSYLHVSQGDIQRFSQKPDDLSDEIKRMLGLHNEDFDVIAISEIEDIFSKYRLFVDFWETVDSEGNRVNRPEYQQAIIDKNAQLINTLTNPQNKELIEQYKLNSKNINEQRSFIDKSKAVLALIDRTLSEINQNVESLNSSPFSLTKIPFIEKEATNFAISSNISKCEEEILILVGRNESIEGQFKQQGINQDISSLLSKVTEYQLSIDSAQQKKIDIQQRTGQWSSHVIRRGELALTYRTFLTEQKDKINNAFKLLKESKFHWNAEQNQLVKEILSDIAIEGAIVFDLEKFYSGLEECINSGKFRSTSDKTTMQRLQGTFCVSSMDDLFELLSGQAIISCDEKKISIEDFLWKPEYFNRGGRYELMNYLFSPASIKRYLYVNAAFEYKGKTVDKLSVGQRGTFYVCLKLATDPFGSPFVFDQPEDDLDNEFIMRQLVPLFKKIKKYRQVIIVTHNANLVVNTDAEQIIVAGNEGEVISYHSGAVEDGCVKEDSGIRAKICNILEGGRYAFEKRDKKYGIRTFS